MLIPENIPLMQEDIEIKIYPTKTYRMDDDRNRITGTVDGLEAMMQAIQRR